MGTTSHLASLDEKHVHVSNPLYRRCSPREIIRERNKVKCLKSELLPNVNLVTYKGLIIMETQFPDGTESRPCPVKEGFRISQCEKLLDQMKRSKERVCFLLLGSNDFKCFLTRGNEWLEVKAGYEARWHFLRSQPEFKFNGRRISLIPEISKNHIQDQVKIFVDILKSWAQKCSFEAIYISSILERDWDGIGVKNLDLWFSYINYFLEIHWRNLNKEKIINKVGQVINWKFINVSNQYFEAVKNNSKDELFRDFEFKSGKMTHRSDQAMKDLISMYLSELEKYF